MSLKECVVCGKTFDGAPSAKYCSEECKNAPQYTNEFNGEKWGKWAATIVFKGKTYHLGRYNNIEDAAAVRKEAEDALFGNFLEWFQEVYPERWKKFNKNSKTDGK